MKKKNLLNKYVLIIIFIILIIFVYNTLFLPGNYKGIDISHHNKICWDCIQKSNIQFCYIKATEGSTFKDNMCISNVNKANNLKINTGLYHYFRTGISAKEQFENFKSVYDKVYTNLIPVIDVEIKGNNFKDKQASLQLSELINLFYKEYGTYPIIYLGSWETIRFFSIIYKCPLWVRCVGFSKLFPNFTIKQTSVEKIGHNYIDINYAFNLNKLKLNEKL